MSEKIVQLNEEIIKGQLKEWRRKFTVGIIVAETARCVSDISVQRLFILYFLCFLLASPLLL